MRFPGVAVILATEGVLLVSSGVAPVGTISPADAKPLAARSRPEVQRSVLQ
jgi:hypothetical protein